MRFLSYLLILALLLGHPTAYAFGTVDFPASADTSDEAVAGFADRANAIIKYVACGREVEYYQNRREMRDDDDDQAGEGLLQILIAKTAWLKDHEEKGESCSFELVLKSDDPNVAKILDVIFDKSLPTRCSVPTYFDITGEAHFVSDVTPACMRAQINEGIRAMEKNSIAGSSGIPCLGGSSPPFIVNVPEGEYDVTLRDLTRLFVMATDVYPVLEAATVKHLWENLLSLRGEPSPASYSLAGLCSDRPGDDFGTPDDYADGKSWFHDVLGVLGDIAEWLLEVSVKLALAAAVGITGTAAIPFTIALDPFSDPTGVLSIQVGETENHRLMIESAKYLTNQKMIDELDAIRHENRDDVKAEQRELREWLLKRLQEIAANDFDEYNARPYTRYSLNAIANLYEFAHDNAIRTASQIVLDLSAAKFAAGSSLGRRIVPFRRLANVDVDSQLYPQLSGSDHEALRAMMFGGQIKFLNNKVDGDVASSMIYAATGNYRWPKQVLDAAVWNTPNRGIFRQDIGHDGTESYYATPAFTMSLGGEPTSAALNTFGGNPNPADHGAAVPSLIVPAVKGTTPHEVFRIRGTDTEEDRETNLCGYEGFICGTNPELPDALYAACRQPPDADGISFFSSIGCFPEGPHFYAAAMVRKCDDSFCDKDESWGLIEVIPAPTAQAGADPGYDRFRTLRGPELKRAVPDKDGKGTYVDRRGHVIKFQIDDDGSTTLSVDGQPFTPKAGRGDIIVRQVSNAGPETVIFSPADGSSITIRFSDWNNPVRIAP